jgi:hypothetical protein
MTPDMMSAGYRPFSNTPVEDLAFFIELDLDYESSRRHFDEWADAISRAAADIIGKEFGFDPTSISVEVDFERGSVWVKIGVGFGIIMAAMEAIIAADQVDKIFQERFPDARTKVVQIVEKITNAKCKGCQEQYLPLMEELRKQGEARRKESGAGGQSAKIPVAQVEPQTSSGRIRRKSGGSGTT